MPWLETNPVDPRSQFIDADLSRAFTKVELCERFQMSRRTGDQWISGYDARGRVGLSDQRRAPKRRPHRIEEAIAALLCAARCKHPDRGPVKLLDWLRLRHPDVAWPAPSTAGDLLKRRGLIKPRKRREKTTHPWGVAPTTDVPNDLWTADFEGEFRTGDDEYCYPLTVADLHTRFLLTRHGLRSTETALARPIFERTFREFGVPRAIRTDNGVPFATSALHGLSHLTVWWMRLGIAHQRIHLGQPQENGAHERVHRTLKPSAVKPVQRTCAAQQKRFDTFRHEHNTERPHEAIGLETPASQYVCSPRPYPTRLPQPVCPGHVPVKRVTDAGRFRFQQRLLYIANALVDRYIGLEETDDGVWAIYFNTVLLATLDDRDFLIRG